MKRKLTNYKRVKHLINTYSDRVKFKEVDSLGIVWHGHYISYFEEGREAFGREHDISYLEIKRNDFSTPVVNVVCNYKKSLRYGETYTIKTFILDNLSAKIIMEYEIYNENHELVCEGQTTQVFVDRDGALALYNPDFYQRWRKENNIID